MKGFGPALPSAPSWPLAAALIVLLLSACSGDRVSVYQTAHESAKKVGDRASEVIEQALATAHRDARVQLLETNFIRVNTGPAISDGEFVEFVCRGYAALPEARVGRAIMTQYYVHISEILKEPTSELGALYESTNRLENELKNGPPSLKAPAVGPLRQQCNSEVTALVSLRLDSINETGLGIDAIATLKSAAETLYNAARAVAILTLTEINDAKRDEAFRSYIKGSDKVIQDAIKNLSAIDTNFVSDCTTYSANKKNDFCQPIIEKGENYTKLDTALIRRKWVALRLPYRRFQQLAQIAPELRSKGFNATILEEGIKVHASLEEFTSLRSVPAPSQIVLLLQKSQSDLLRVAAGDFKRDEWIAMITARAERLGEIIDAIKKAAAEGEKSVNEIRKL